MLADVSFVAAALQSSWIVVLISVIWSDKSVVIEIVGRRRMSSSLGFEEGESSDTWLLLLLGVTRESSIMATARCAVWSE